MQRLLLLFLLAGSPAGHGARAQLSDSARAQTEQARLQAAVDTHPAPDTGRVNRLNALAFAQRAASPRLSAATLREALALARQLSYTRGQAQAWLGLGFYHRKRSEYGPAVDNTLRAQEAFTWLRDRPNQLGCFYNLAYIFSGQGDFPQALRNARQGLQLAQDLDDQKWLVLTNMQLGNISTSLGEYDKARTYLQAGQRLAERAQDGPGISQGLRGLGQLYRTQGQWAAARSYYEQDAALARRLGDVPGAVVEEINIADMHERQDHYPAAFATGRRVLRRLRELDMVGYVPLAQLVLARAHLHTGRPDSALHYARASLAAGQRSGVKETSRDAAEVLAQASAAQADFAAAYRHQMLLGAYRDSLNSRELIRRTTALHYSYDMGQQQARIRLLLKNQQQAAQASRRQLVLLLTLLGFLALLAGTLALLLRHLRHQQRAREQIGQANDELRLLRETVTRQQYALEKLKVSSAQ